MIIIEKTFTITEMNTAKLEQLITKTLNHETKIENCQIFNESYDYLDVDDKFLLQNIPLNVEINMSPESDEYDAELVQLTLVPETEMSFDDETEIENFIDEIVQKLEQTF